jgi:hypothetical protein
VIGRSVNLDGRAVTVIGVVEEKFKGPFALVDMDAYAPVGLYGGATGSTSFFTGKLPESLCLGLSGSAAEHLLPLRSTFTANPVVPPTTK